MDDLAVAEELRAFNRFYTEAIGSLDEAHEGLPVTLAQARMLFTAGALSEPDVGDIAAALGLDLAYTSRVLGTLEDAGYVDRVVTATDRRRKRVRLTREGAARLADVEARSNARMLGLVAHLDEHDRRRLLGAAATIRELIERRPKEDTA